MTLIFEIEMIYYMTFVVDFLYTKVKNIDQQFLSDIKSHKIDECDENQIVFFVNTCFRLYFTFTETFTNSGKIKFYFLIFNPTKKSMILLTKEIKVVFKRKR